MIDVILLFSFYSRTGDYINYDLCQGERIDLKINIVYLTSNIPTCE